MSVVIGIKDNNTIYLGADSQSTRGWNKVNRANKSNFKIWEVSGTKNNLMGAVGLARESNVITVSKIIDELTALKKEVDFSYVVKTIVPNMFKELKSNGVITDNPKAGDVVTFNNEYLLATSDKLFFIGYDGCVLEIDEYIAIGSGEDYAIAVLNSTIGKAPRDRIIEAIKATAKNHIYVDFPIVIADTKSMKFEVVTADDVK